MKKKLIFTVGNGMMGDDGAGALLAAMVQEAPLLDWEVLNGGSAPENVLFRVREMKPDQVLVIDAADMDLPPGTIRLIPDEQLVDPFLMTTHTLPLSYLIQALREFVPQVELLGIQPDVVAFGFPMSSSVKTAVEQVYAGLKHKEQFWEIHALPEMI